MVTPSRIRTLELGALLALLAAIYAFALTSPLRDAAPPPVAIGMALDLTLTAAAATWWLGVRGAGLPRRAPLVVFGVGALTARLILPAQTQAAHLALGAGLALELLVAATVVVRAPRLVRRLRADAGLPLLLRLTAALEDVGLPRLVARILASELATLPLALTGWVRRAPRAGFSVHRTHCALATHAVLAVLIAAETVALHLLLARVSPMAAWIATGSSVYALFWVIGDAHALRLGRIRVEEGAVVVEIARRWAAVIPRDSIVAVHRETAVAPGTLDLAIETPTVALELSVPVTARGLFGRTRSGSRVALTIDDPAGFIAALGLSLAR
ncbi:MAG TPA: hypothetical protein VNO30_33945 [Kofleriaceae bacterium]|nr:hypothetical protein [Kofleriaceae bacterium]